MSTHEHRFDLQLGADGHGRIYGDYEGYVRQCKCGEYAPDFEEWKARRVAYLKQRALVIAREVEASVSDSGHPQVPNEGVSE